MASFVLQLSLAPKSYYSPSPRPPPRRPLPPHVSPSATALAPDPRTKTRRTLPPPPRALSPQELAGAKEAFIDLLQASPPTWKSAVAGNLLVFVVGSPILASGLTASGAAAAFLLGTLSWRAFGLSGFLVVVAYFVVGTLATKVKIKQKEALGIAEKRSGRRGPGSVIGSGAAACVCGLLSIYGLGGDAFIGLWQLGFLSSFCTKLSDTVSSEIGKAYGKTTYLATTLKVVPRGTEGAISVEGTFAGLLASVVLATIGHYLGEVNIPQAVVCVLASQIANFGESLIGAAIQEKDGFQWLNNDVVNVINISLGSILAIVMQQLVLENRLF